MQGSKPPESSGPIRVGQEKQKIIKPLGRLNVGILAKSKLKQTLLTAINKSKETTVVPSQEDIKILPPLSEDKKVKVLSIVKLKTPAAKIDVEQIINKVGNQQETKIKSKKFQKQNEVLVIPPNQNKTSDVLCKARKPPPISVKARLSQKINEKIAAQQKIKEAIKAHFPQNRVNLPETSSPPAKQISNLQDQKESGQKQCLEDINKTPNIPTERLVSLKPSTSVVPVMQFSRFAIKPTRIQVPSILKRPVTVNVSSEPIRVLPSSPLAKLQPVFSPVMEYIDLKNIPVVFEGEENNVLHDYPLIVIPSAHSLEKQPDVESNASYNSASQVLPNIASATSPLLKSNQSLTCPQSQEEVQIPSIRKDPFYGYTQEELSVSKIEKGKKKTMIHQCLASETVISKDLIHCQEELTKCRELKASASTSEVLATEKDAAQQVTEKPENQKTLPPKMDSMKNLFELDSPVSLLFKNSLREMQKKLSQSLNESGASDKMSLMLEKLNEDSFLNEIVEFAKEKIEKSVLDQTADQASVKALESPCNSPSSSQVSDASFNDRQENKLVMQPIPETKESTTSEFLERNETESSLEFELDKTKNKLQNKSNDSFAQKNERVAFKKIFRQTGRPKPIIPALKKRASTRNAAIQKTQAEVSTPRTEKSVNNDQEDISNTGQLKCTNESKPEVDRSFKDVEISPQLPTVEIEFNLIKTESSSAFVTNIIPDRIEKAKNSLRPEIVEDSGTELSSILFNDSEDSCPLHEEATRASENSKPAEIKIGEIKTKANEELKTVSDDEIKIEADETKNVDELITTVVTNEEKITESAVEKEKALFISSFLDNPSEPHDQELSDVKSAPKSEINKKLPRPRTKKGSTPAPELVLTNSPPRSTRSQQNKPTPFLPFRNNSSRTRKIVKTGDSTSEIETIKSDVGTPRSSRSTRAASNADKRAQVEFFSRVKITQEATNDSKQKKQLPADPEIFSPTLGKLPEEEPRNKVTPTSKMPNKPKRKRAASSSDDEPLAKMSETVEREDSAKHTVKEGPETSLQSTKTQFACGNCKTMVPKAQWISHLHLHVGLTWRIGMDKPFDLQNENVCLNVMRHYKKDHKKATITCPICKNESRKSADGLIAHMRNCGKTREEMEANKVSCQYCGARLTKESLPIHIRNCCPVLKRMQEEESLAKAQKKRLESGAVEYSASGRVKRLSSKKAQKKLRKVLIENLFDPETLLISNEKPITSGIMRYWRTLFNRSESLKCFYKCGHFSKTVEDAISHHDNCVELEYSCSNCEIKSQNRGEVIEHIKLAHTPPSEPADEFENVESDASEVEEMDSDSSQSVFSEVDESEADMEEEEEEEESDMDDFEKSKRQKKQKPKRHPKENVDSYVNKFKNMRYLAQFEKIDLMSAYQEFTKKHFSERLFADWKPGEVNLLTKSHRLPYEPIGKTSLDFMVASLKSYSSVNCSKPTNKEWCRMKIYEGGVTDGSPIFFCGGPIRALEWLPLPHSETSMGEVLAVVPGLTWHYSKYSGKNEEKASIQLWSTGNYSNANVPRLVKPKFLYSMAIEDGPVHDVKFCPSGGFINGERLGLLAVASLDKNINVYSLPTKEDKSFDLAESNQMVKLKSVVCLNHCFPPSGYPVKISWSKQNNHSRVAAGFSNGQISIWHLNVVKSRLLQKTHNGVQEIFPVHIFLGHQECITALEWNKDELLVSGSLDRRLKVFKVVESSSPQEIYNVYKKSRVSCVGLSAHLPFILYCLDSDFCLKVSELRGTFILEAQPDDVKFGPFMSLNASISDMSCNEWTNQVLMATAAGDLFGYFLSDYLNYDTRSTEKAPKKIAITQTSGMKDSTKEHDDDEDYSSIVFGDIEERAQLQPNYKNITQAEDHTRAPTVRINKVTFNPNKNAFNCAAIGYESGFVRLKKVTP